MPNKVSMLNKGVHKRSAQGKAAADIVVYCPEYCSALRKVAYGIKWLTAEELERLQ
jgi:hypothetical protein